MLVVAPAYVLVLLDQFRFTGWPEDGWGTARAELVAFVVGWLAFPLAAIPLTRLLGLSARYVPLIVANNWSAVIQVALYTAVVVLGTILPGELRMTALFTATIMVLAYQWLVIRTALAHHRPDRIRPGGDRRAAQHHGQPHHRWPAAARGVGRSRVRSSMETRKPVAAIRCSTAVRRGDGVSPRSATDMGC